jgi:hypothetical protein
MLKKMIIVATLLAMVTPALAYQVGGTWNTNHGALDFKKDDDGKNLDPLEWNKAPGGDRTVDWETNGNFTQRKAEVWNWPATYDYVNVCNIPVQMEIGFWMQVEGCRDKRLRLKQVAVNKYRGQVDCKVSANVATQWSATFTQTYSALGANRDYIRVDDTSGKTGGDGTTLKLDPVKNKQIWIALGLKEVDLSGAAPTNDCLEIGYVTLRVKPNVRPNQYMSGCDASGAGFGTPGYNYYAPPTSKVQGYVPPPPPES